MTKWLMTILLLGMAACFTFTYAFSQNPGEEVYLEIELESLMVPADLGTGIFQYHKDGKPVRCPHIDAFFFEEGNGNFHSGSSIQRSYVGKNCQKIRICSWVNSLAFDSWLFSNSKTLKLKIYKDKKLIVDRDFHKGERLVDLKLN